MLIQTVTNFLHILGISVGLTAIPQGIAYAGVAGLPLEVYSNFPDFVFSYCSL